MTTSDPLPGDGHGPIFIGGLSHSGKTPLRLMLSAHPNLALSRRTYMWQRYYGRFGDLAEGANLDRCLAAMLAHPAVQALSPDEAGIRRDFGRGPATYGQLFAVIHARFAATHGKRRWGAQIGLIEEYADVIFADYPGARLIHMMADPRQRGRAAAGGRRAGKTGWETAKWLHSARLARRNQARYPGRYLVVNHEALIERPEAILGQICDFLGETYRPEMVTMEAAIRFGDDEAAASQPASPGRSLPGRDLAFTQAYAGRQIAALGYPLAPVSLSLKDRLLFNVLDRPANLASLVAWRAVRTLRNPALL